MSNRSTTVGVHYRSRKVILGWTGALILLVSGSIPTLAYDPTDRFSIAGGVGISFCDMGDVNDEISSGNRFLSSRNWTTVDQLNTGFNFNYELRANVLGSWYLSLGGGRIAGETGVDFDQVIDIKPSTNFFSARVLWQAPWRPIESVRLFLGGGVANFTGTQLEVSHEQRDVETGTLRVETLTLEGSGWGALTTLEAELILSETATIVGDAGYRFFSTEYEDYEWNISALNNPALDDDGDGIANEFDLSENSYLREAFGGENLHQDGDLTRSQPNDGISLDFSGFQLNVGLRFYLF